MKFRSIVLLVIVGCTSDLAPPTELVLDSRPTDPGPEETGTPQVDPTVPKVPKEQVIQATVALVDAPDLPEVLAWHCTAIGYAAPLCSTLGNPVANDLAVVLELDTALPPGPVLSEARLWARVWGEGIGGICLPLGANAECAPPPGLTSTELVRGANEVDSGVFRLTLSGPEYITLGGDLVTTALDQVLAGQAPEPALRMAVSVWAEFEAELPPLLVAPEQATTVAFP